MKTPGAVALTVVSLAALCPTPAARACTTVCLSRGKRVLVAKSYDFHVGHGMVVLNKRGVQKQALTLSRGQRPARWVSRYGSVTFNQYGRELPLGGMNERGLVVEIMWLNGTQHPALTPKRETVNELQLIQLLLDSCGTVKQALARLERLQVQPMYAKVHYMICDAGGRCATLEHLGGRRVVHAGKDLPLRVLTNHPYAVSLGAARRYRGLGGRKPLPSGRGSLARFVRAASHSKTFARRSKVHDVTRAFHILEDVQQGDYTKWQIVYEPTASRVTFRAGPGWQQSTIVLRRHKQGCAEPVQVMDMTGSLRPGKRAWVRYSPELNRKLVQQSFADLRAPLPAIMVQHVARLPRSMRCSAR